MRILVIFILVICLSNLAAAAGNSANEGNIKKIIIVAGQSNTVNFHADVSFLPKDSNDAKILFYFHSGMPPSSETTNPFNASSKGEWKTLKYQSQDPYISLKADFFGPEMSLARKIYNAGYDIAVIKMASSGTNLAADWKKGTVSGNQLYSILMRQIDTAVTKLKKMGYTPEFTGFFWMQGESDANNSSYANNYKTNLTKFISDIRNDLNNLNLPFILGRIGNKSSYSYKEVVRTAQVEVASTVKGVRWVNTDDFLYDTDNIHYLGGSVYLLGERMADEWLKLNINNIRPQQVPAEFKVYPNFPNPFNPETTIRFEIPNSGKVRLTVCNILGQNVNSPVEKHFLPGMNSFKITGINLSAGVYIYTLTFLSESGNIVFTVSGKLLLIK